MSTGTDASRGATDGAAAPTRAGRPATGAAAPPWVPGPRAWNRAELEAAAVVGTDCAVTMAAWAAHIGRPVAECLAKAREVQATPKRLGGGPVARR